ncbi:MAG TPA: copper chaperone PCu(A)C [Stellaceae bacterium]|nr:copper chaperone PCu(A)C [Stellaceae bacterium]
MRKMFVLAAFFLLTGVSLAAAQTSGIEVQKAWARATPGGAKTAAVYLTLINKGNAPDRLVSVSTPAAGMADVHTTVTENGVMKMRPTGPLEVKPGTPTVFKPGGYHIMLMDLKGPLVAGQKIALSLTFEKAGKMDVTATVEKAGAMGPGAMPGMKM